MSSNFFLNPTIIQEILVWQERSGENLTVFEPIARACARASEILGREKSDTSPSQNKLEQMLLNWCGSDDFAFLIAESGKKGASLGLDLARSSLSQYSGSESFVEGFAIDHVLQIFSAFLRADLRSRESRSSVRIDELHIYRSFYRELDLHDFCLLLISAAAAVVPAGQAESESFFVTISLFNALLCVKESPGTLIQVDGNLLMPGFVAEFKSGLRMLALSNLDSAYQAFEKSRAKAANLPIATASKIAMSLVAILRCQTENACDLISQSGQEDPGAEIPASIKAAIELLVSSVEHGPYGEQTGKLNFDDPIYSSILVNCHLRRRDYQAARERLAKGSKEANPLASLLLAESIVVPLKASLLNDPCLPGGLNQQDKDELEQAKEILLSLRSESYVKGWRAIEEICNLNLSCIFMILRDFSTALKCARAAQSPEESKSESKVNEAIACLALGDLPNLQRSLEGLSKRMPALAKQLKAESFYHACLFSEAEVLWQESLAQEKDRLWCLRILCRLLEIYRLTRNSNRAQFCVNELIANYQQEPETILALAYELWQQNRVEEASSALKRAKESALPRMKKWIAWELGRILFDAGQNLSATDEYASIVDSAIDSIQGREFAVALFKSGLLPAAHERAKSLRLANGDVIAGITEIEADYLVRTQNLQDAKILLIRLCQIRPLSVLNRLALIRIFVAVGQLEDARNELLALRELDLSQAMSAELDAYCKDFDTILAAHQN